MAKKNIGKNNIRKYILVTPCKNEEEYLPKLIESVVSQDIKPVAWLIVNDGSTDKSLEIIKKASAKNKWIKFISLDQAKRDLVWRYSIVVKSGFDHLIEYCKKKKINYSYVGLLDADIVMDEKYFSSLMREIDSDKKLGIAGGGLYYDRQNGLEYEFRYEDSPSGAARLWRRETFEQAGGFQITSAPDTVSNIKAELRGWKAREFKNIKAVQRRETSSAEGLWKGYKSGGVANYYLGMNFFVSFLKAIKLTFQKPYYIGMAYFYGYMKSLLTGKKRTEDKEILDYYSKTNLTQRIRKLAK